MVEFDEDPVPLCGLRHQGVQREGSGCGLRLEADEFFRLVQLLKKFTKVEVPKAAPNSGGPPTPPRPPWSELWLGRDAFALGRFQLEHPVAQALLDAFQAAVSISLCAFFRDGSVEAESEGQVPLLLGGLFLDRTGRSCRSSSTSRCSGPSLEADGREIEQSFLNQGNWWE